MSDLYGPIKAQYNVEVSVITTLRTWLAEYLAEIERQNDLLKGTLPRPPVPESLHGGLNFEGWKDAELPSVIVVTNPEGDAVYHGSAGYEQAYLVEVGVVVRGDGGVFATLAEDDARITASLYGAAVGLLAQHGDLGGFAERTKLTQAARLELQDPDQVEYCTAITTFTVWVPEILIEDAGPFGLEPKETLGYPGVPEAPPAPLPSVTTTTLTTRAVSPTEQV